MQWLNQQYIKAADITKLASNIGKRLTLQGVAIESGPDLEEVVKVLLERVKTLVEMADKAAMFYQDFDEFDENAAKKQLRPEIEEPLKVFRNRLANLDDWVSGSIQALVEKTAEDFDLKMGKIGQPIRVAVTGAGMSPPIDQTIYLIGKTRALRGLDKALSYIEKRAANS